ncbi:signal recognition particle subunit SRP68-like [Centruroides sculpturatus]|uniref:signal recognition particle subunit SRP68-like n=1 Tax=Centruroides sculpturatus TaxID=218467 RepID=UPI000C6DA861|nr:signal recognition particle subunit SRP68-like [Centruroides sculpturatus]
MATGDSVSANESKQAENKSNLHKQTFTLEILHIIKDAQQQHGLRHGDYQRYRSYCSRRLRRLRKSLHFVQGTKHRFQAKKVTEDILTDIRYLYIPLMTAERAWGHAMQLKQEANTEPRKRFHLITRLRKAVKHIEELESLCESTKCDARTKLEAQAYAAWIRGSLKFELQEWQPAMEYFRRSQTIYEKLSQALNEDERALYKQRVEELTPNIRYCAYNIGDESAINDLMQMRLSGKTGGEDILATNLDNLIAQTREKQAATLSEVTWLGRTVPVRQEKVRVFLLNVQESEVEVNKAPDLEAKIAVYERLLLECKDALQVIKDELKSDQNYKLKTQSHGTQYSLSYLHSYLIYIRLSKTIERNLLLIQSLKKNLEQNIDNNSDGKKSTKPQDLIRPYEIIIQNLSEMTQLSGIDSNSNFIEEVNNQILAYKAHRCYYIAQAYSSVNKWVEAMALYQRALDYSQRALKSDTLDKKLTTSLKELEGLIEGCKYSAHALSILGKDQQADQSNQTLIDKKTLMERLDIYCEDQSLLSRQPNIARFPPDFKPIPCKPLFFDLALNHVEFPSLDDRLEQKKGGGITGFVKGWLGWKK